VFERYAGLTPADLERVTLVLPNLEACNEPFPNGDPTLVSGVFILKAARPYQRDKLLKALSTGGRAKQYQGKTYYFNEKCWGALYLADDRTVLFGSEDAVLWLLQKAERKRYEGPLSPSLRWAAEKAPLVVAFNPAVLTDAHLQKLPPPLRDVLRAEALTFLVDLDKQFSVNARVRFASPAKATAGEASVKSALELGRQGLAVGMAQLGQKIKEEDNDLPSALGQVYGLALVRHADRILKAAVVERKGTTVSATLSTDHVELAPVTVVSLFSIAALGRNAQATFQYVGSTIGGGTGTADGNLRELHKGFEKYYQDKGSYPPPAIHGKKGEALLSWRVALLPYLGEEKLYKEFRLDEPWDSLHNKKLLHRMPKVLQQPYAYGAQKYKTTFQGFAGPGAVFEGTKGHVKADFKGPGQPILVAVIDRDQSTYWSKPADVTFTANGPFPQFMGKYAYGFSALFADGTVRFFTTKDTPEKTLRGLVTGGEKAGAAPQPFKR
jgi:hypothetical protein